jgi:hypothetical protein
MLIRLLAGVTLGMSFFFLVWNADLRIGRALGVNMHAEPAAIILFPLTMFFIAILVSVLIESIARFALCRKPPLDHREPVNI